MPASFAPSHHRFYGPDGELLLELGPAMMYDTTTPCQYVMRRFAELADLIRNAQPVTAQSEPDMVPRELRTVDEFRAWVATSFNDVYNGGFEQYIT